MAGVVRFEDDGSIDASFGHDGVAWVPSRNNHIPIAAIGPDDRITVATETYLTDSAFSDVTVARRIEIRVSRDGAATLIRRASAQRAQVSRYDLGAAAIPS